MLRVGRRGARLARREEEEYSTYCDEEQRSRAGWIVAPIGTVIFERVLSTTFQTHSYRRRGGRAGSHTTARPLWLLPFMAAQSLSAASLATLM